jgi:hypothetical protein
MKLLLTAVTLALGLLAAAPANAVPSTNAVAVVAAAETAPVEPVHYYGYRRGYAYGYIAPRFVYVPRVYGFYVGPRYGYRYRRY